MRYLLDTRIVFKLNCVATKSGSFSVLRRAFQGRCLIQTMRMPQTLSKGSVIFIDSYNGENNGVNVSQLESVLRDIGMVRFLMVSEHADCLL